MPGSAFFVRVGGIVQVGGEVEQHCWFVADYFEAVPIVTWHPHHLHIVASGDYFG
jgi:hypothetical protein